MIELDKDLYGPDNHLVEVSTYYCEKIACLYSNLSFTDAIRYEDNFY